MNTEQIKYAPFNCKKRSDSNEFMKMVFNVRGIFLKFIKHNKINCRRQNFLGKYIFIPHIFFLQVFNLNIFV